MKENSEEIIKSLSDIFENMDSLPEGKLKESIQKIISKSHEIDEQTEDNEEIQNNRSF